MSYEKEIYIICKKDHAAPAASTSYIQLVVSYVQTTKNPMSNLKETILMRKRDHAAPAASKSYLVYHVRDQKTYGICKRNKCHMQKKQFSYAKETTRLLLLASRIQFTMSDVPETI